MKIGEKGFTLIELLIAAAISAIMATAAGSVIFQTFKGMDRNNDQITVVRQLENAGYWLSRDTQMARSVSTNVTPDFLTLQWTEWNDAGTATYHSIRYFFDNVTDGVGRLVREHSSTGATKKQTVVARYIHWVPSQTDNTSKATYDRPVLTVKLVARFSDTQETREYRARHRPQS